MANNKIQLSDGTVLLDLTADTAIASDVAQGKRFHLANGTQAVGTNTGGGGDAVDMYAGRDEPTAAVGDLWVDTSDERGDWPPSTIVAGNTPVLLNPTFATCKSEDNLQNTGITLSIKIAGTYKFSWFAAGEDGETVYSRLYKNGTAVGTQKSMNKAAGILSDTIQCNVGDTIAIWSRGFSSWSTVYGTTGMLAACIEGDNGF